MLKKVIHKWQRYIYIYIKTHTHTKKTRKIYTHKKNNVHVLYEKQRYTRKKITSKWSQLLVLLDDSPLPESSACWTRVFLWNFRFNKNQQNWNTVSSSIKTQISLTDGPPPTVTLKMQISEQFLCKTENMYLRNTKFVQRLNALCFTQRWLLNIGLLLKYCLAYVLPTKTAQALLNTV